MANLLLPPGELQARLSHMSRDEIKNVYDAALAVSRGSKHPMMPDTARLIVAQIQTLYPGLAS